jgi:hypothetical protein
MFFFIFYRVDERRDLQPEEESDEEVDSDNENEDGGADEQVSALVSKEQQLLTDVASTVDQILGRFAFSYVEGLSLSLPRELICRQREGRQEGCEFEIMSHTQEVSLFQLLLLCRDFMTITRYLVVFHRSRELMLFCIRFSTSANFFLHRDNKTGCFSSSTAYSEISRYYYYSKFQLGISMKAVDFKVLFECSVPSSSSDSSASFHSSMETGLSPLKPSVIIADDNDDDDDEEDDDRFKVDNMSYFKDRSSVLASGDADQKKALNQERMNEAVKIFFITMKYYLTLLHHPYLDAISKRKTQLLRCIKEIILCRPLTLGKPELVNFLEGLKEEYDFLSNEKLSDVFTMVNGVG